MSISSAPELELSLISFAGSGSTATWQGGDKRKRRWREGWGWGDYFKHVGLRGRFNIRQRRLIEGRLLFEDCFVSESWLSMIILSHSHCPEGYVMVRKDRAGSRIGGGVAMIWRNNWKGKALNVTDSLEFESLVGDHVALYTRWPRIAHQNSRFINKLRTPEQGIVRISHDRRRLLILAHKVPCPCFMFREFCFAT